MKAKRTLRQLMFFIVLPVLTLSPPVKGEGEKTAYFSYRLAVPGRTLSFPADHYSHPDFKTEWWYYTGHLQAESGQRFGYQVTFFRFGVRDRQTNINEKPPLFTELYMAHFALSNISGRNFLFRERINRGIGEKAAIGITIRFR
jgi:predicted secreted hydrolase